MDATRWANVPANEELSWRSRPRDEPKEETAPVSKEEEEEEEEEEAVDEGDQSTGRVSSERSDVWRPGGGEYL